MAIDRVAVIGGGVMGSGIAEVAARGGCDTIVFEVDAGQAEQAQKRIEASIARAVDRNKLTSAEAESTIANLSYTTRYEDLADRDLVIEAVLESREIKSKVFVSLDRVTGPDCILATNTSSISIGEIAAVTARPERVLGMHFFNPATVQQLVEVIPSETTSPEVVEAVAEFARDRLGKHVIRTIDRAGFVVNRLLVPYLLSAMVMLDHGQATAEDIDAGMRLGCAHPQGPLELSDLVGLDTLLLVSEVLYEEFNERLYSPPAILRRMVTAGHLGRKSGRGFYNYEDR